MKTRVRVLTLVVTLACGVGALVGVSIASAQEEDVTATSAADESSTPVPPTNTAEPQISTATPSSVETVVAPRPVISDNSSVTGRIVEEKVGGDGPARTLVELQLHAVLDGSGQPQPSANSALISLLTDGARGTFSFNEIPAGTHLLWVWDGSGFTNVAPNAVNSGLYLTEIAVSGAGEVRGNLPPEIRIREKPPGVLGYPVRGGEAGARVYEGAVNVREALEGRGPSGLPSTGSGSREATVPLVALVAGCVILVVAGVSLRRALRRT